MNSPDINIDDNLVNIIPEPFSYNKARLNDFYDFVFGELPDDEYPLGWRASSGRPSFPKELETLIETVARSPVAHPLYFGTATVYKDPDGKLYNRQKNFAGLYVVVLDDVGTKVPIEKIPENLTPSYIIESSQGNFQYGYVLKEPVRSLAAAKTLIQLVYESGLSDEGGKMANKLVRLPDGVNGKKGEKGKFHVKLVEQTDRYWTPEELLAIIAPKINWDDVLNSRAVVMDKMLKKAGAAAYADGAKDYMTAEGIIDPVLEWLNTNNRIINDAGDWVTIECPWCDEHSDGNVDAGYSPLGRGEKNYFHGRGFHCFHEHCADKTINDFLQHIHLEGAPSVPAYEYHFDKISRFVFDKHNDGIWDLSPLYPDFTSTKSMTTVFTRKTNVMGDRGMSLMNEMQYFCKVLETKTVVNGVKFDATTELPIVIDESGKRYMNSFKPPLWGDGDFNPDNVSFFTDYVRYLISDEHDQEYFLDWLACKAQNMGFRGQAIIMVALTQGMGRTTLSKLIAAIFGQDNTENVPFDKLTSDGQWNAFLAKPFVFTDETLAIAKDDSVYKVYERLKDIVDTTPKKVTFNPKYGKQWTDFTYASFMMYSNHANAMMMSGEDRRFYVIENTRVPAKPEYFALVNRKLDEVSYANEDCWARDVWRFLRERKVAPEQMLKKTQVTAAKEQMLTMGLSPLDHAVTYICKQWDLKLITLPAVKKILEPLMMRIAPDLSTQKRNFIIQRKFMELTQQAAKGKKFKVDGAAMRVYTFPDVISEGGLYLLSDNAKEMYEEVQIYRNHALEEMVRIQPTIIEELESEDKL